MQDTFLMIQMDKLELESIIQKTIQQELNKKKEKELLSFKETCDFLGIHISTLNKWKAEGKIPFKKLGKRVFFHRSELIAAMEESKQDRFKEVLKYVRR